jgi:hypothetical protein
MTLENPPLPTTGLRILYVATKPPYPPQDGGRLLIWNTLTELASRGHRITYVAPDLGAETAVARRYLESVCEAVHLIRARPSGLLWSAAAALATRKPMSVLRHSHRSVQVAISELLREQSFDVVHAEQIQAFYNLPPMNGRLPVVLRAQNVESELWRLVAVRRPHLAWIARDEARKMAVFEARAIRAAAATVVLTQPDAETLGGGAGAASRRITVVRPPFPQVLPWYDEPLEGNPPIVVLTGGWLPNRDSLSWFLEEIWPGILGANPDAHAHIFGPDGGASGPSVSCHPAPADSKQFFRPGTILAVPLRIASGIRMKILESWARRVPVIATPTAVRGLEDIGNDGYLLASNGAEFGSAVERLRRSPKVAQELIDAGQETLADHFRPEHAAGRLEVVYREAMACAGIRDVENGHSAEN